MFAFDARGRLRIVCERAGAKELARKRSARRREAVASKRSRVIHLRRPPGVSLAIVPVPGDDEVLGVLEVSGDTSDIERSIEALDVVGGQTATVLHNVRLMEHLRFCNQAVVGLAQLMSELLAARSRSRAVWSAVRFCWAALEAPTAGWLRESDGDGFRLVASRGIGRDTKAALELSASAVSDPDAVARSATEVLEGALPVVTSGRDAVLLVESVPEGHENLLDVVGEGLSLALDRLAMTNASMELTRSVDTGLGWTAHEIRAPLLAIEKAIDRITDRDRLGAEDRHFLVRAQGDLHRLSVTVDDLLRWSVGMASLRFRRTDLAKLVAETMRALSLETGGRRVSVEVPVDAVVRVDPVLLRIAMENLVRNSLEHGGDDIRVTVALSDGEATVSVHDRGAGVPEPEHEVIFQPFVRGSGAGHGGRGLGLVIAKRVVEAHGGELWFEDGAPGSIFHMRIPSGAA